MAIDQTAKQLSLAGKLRDAAIKLDDLAAEVQQLAAEFPQAGTMTDVIFEGTSLAHMDANDVATLVARFSATDTTNGLVGWLNDGFRRDILRKVR
jgi:hypothetical protein